jgi:hypothetical protein
MLPDQDGHGMPSPLVDPYASWRWYGHGAIRDGTQHRSTIEAIDEIVIIWRLIFISTLFCYFIMSVCKILFIVFTKRKCMSPARSCYFPMRLCFSAAWARRLTSCLFSSTRCSAGVQKSSPPRALRSHAATARLEQYVGPVVRRRGGCRIGEMKIG